MASDTHKADSACGNILPFPKRNKGRVRKSDGLSAMGDCTLAYMARSGEAPPENVERMALAGQEPDMDRMAMLLALSLFASASKKSKAQIRDAVISGSFGRGHPVELTELSKWIAERT